MLIQSYHLKPLHDMALTAFKQLSRDTPLFQIAKGMKPIMIAVHIPY